MGNVAASGGYYVAAGATMIVAQPGTVTGSIGVFAGKPNLRKLWNKVGVTFDSVATSDNAFAYSTVHGYDEAGWASLQASLDQIYADFKSRVADGRSMTDAEVEAVAKGRVWSGTRAKAVGLVDELGGLNTAIEIAKDEAGLPSGAPANVAVYPAPRSWVAKMISGSNRDNSESVQSRAQGLRLQELRSTVQTLDSLGLGPRDRGVLRVSPVSIDGNPSLR
jgi:protease-4